MKFLLDTDTLSFLAREASPELVARVRRESPGNLALSVVTRGEIEYGILAQPPHRTTLDRTRALMSGIPTLPITTDAALRYATLRNQLCRAGTPIGCNDMWIAAQGLADDLIVVTNNEREFRRVPGLQVENWLR